MLQIAGCYQNRRSTQHVDKVAILVCEVLLLQWPVRRVIAWLYSFSHHGLRETKVVCCAAATWLRRHKRWVRRAQENKPRAALALFEHFLEGLQFYVKCD